jgi:hypothetical protein
MKAKILEEERIELEAENVEEAELLKRAYYNGVNAYSINSVYSNLRIAVLGATLKDKLICPKCGWEMKNCCAEATKHNYAHSCGESEDYCTNPKCGYHRVAGRIVSPNLFWANEKFKSDDDATKLWKEQK